MSQPGAHCSDKGDQGDREAKSKIRTEETLGSWRDRAVGPRCGHDAYPKNLDRAKGYLSRPNKDSLLSPSSEVQALCAHVSRGTRENETHQEEDSIFDSDPISVSRANSDSDSISDSQPRKASAESIVSG